MMLDMEQELSTNANLAGFYHAQGVDIQTLLVNAGIPPGLSGDAMVPLNESEQNSAMEYFSLMGTTPSTNDYIGHKGITAEE